MNANREGRRAAPLSIVAQATAATVAVILIAVAVVGLAVRAGEDNEVSVPRAAEPQGVVAPVASARIGDLVTSRGSRTPVRLRIPELEVSNPIKPVSLGTAGDKTGMEIPDDVVNVGWYAYGPSPGEEGSAVLAAHVDTYEEGAGVFFELRKLKPGSRFRIDYSDGSSRRFVVSSNSRFGKSGLPTEELFARSGAPRVALVTCGGTFDRQARSYSDNVVVTAVPIKAA